MGRSKIQNIITAGFLLLMAWSLGLALASIFVDSASLFLWLLMVFGVVTIGGGFAAHSLTSRLQERGWRPIYRREQRVRITVLVTAGLAAAGLLIGAADGWFARAVHPGIEAFGAGDEPSVILRALLGLLVTVLGIAPVATWYIVEATRSWRRREPLVSSALHDPATLLAMPYALSPADMAGLLRRRTDEQLLLAELVQAGQREWIKVAFPRRLARIEAATNSELPRGAVLSRRLPLVFGSADAKDLAAITAAQQAAVERAEHAVRTHRVLGGRARNAWRTIHTIALALASIAFVVLTLWLLRSDQLANLTVLALLNLVVIGVIVAAALWSARVAPLTPEGEALVAQVEAFDLFIGQAGPEQLAVAAEDSGESVAQIAFEFLPYAIALGRGGTWYQRFQQVFREAAPTVWYAKPSQLTQLLWLDRSTRERLRQEAARNNRRLYR